ncbi:MAG: type II secretion system protein [Candidatus Paceibacterota bacterium]|jgi:prepilin-type N-terminal cleavage/methylation domain-containing protein
MKKGFTLIELLVVIAIIGILSSVVLASLTSARTKGADGAIKSALQQFRAQAELDADTIGAATSNKLYSTATIVTCGAAAATNVFGTTKGAKILANAFSNSNTTASGSKCGADADSYVIAVPLRSKSTDFWCVDSEGNSNVIVGANFTPASPFACPAS